MDDYNYRYTPEQLNEIFDGLDLSTPDMQEAIQTLMESGNIESMSHSGDGCYDAVICDDGELILTEITLLPHSTRVEDFNCTCPDDEFCIHLAALFQFAYNHLL